MIFFLLPPSSISSSSTLAVRLKSFTRVSRSENATLVETRLAPCTGGDFHNLIYIGLIRRRFRCTANFAGRLSRIKRSARPSEFLNSRPSGFLSGTFFETERGRERLALLFPIPRDSSRSTKRGCAKMCIARSRAIPIPHSCAFASRRVAVID